MNDNNLEEYIEIFKIFLNHYNSKDELPLTPKEIKENFGMGKSKTKEYEQRKRSLDRSLEFYSFIKLITIQTDTTLNELNRLDIIRKNRYLSLTERKKLDPYIKYLKEERKTHTFQTKVSNKIKKDDKCKKYNLVKRLRKVIEVYVDVNNTEIDDNLLKKLPKYKKEIIHNPLKEYPIDNKGYFIINERLKVKKIVKTPLTFEFYGKKFQNLTTNMKLDFKDEEAKTKNLSDNITIDAETFTIVDFDTNTLRAENCLYRLTKDINCDLEMPIEFNLPTSEKIDMFVKFLINNIDKVLTDDGVYESDITSPLVSTVINSDAFGENKGFVAQTIGNILLFNHNNIGETKVKYPLNFLIQIIESECSINIEFENFGNTIKLQKTKIKKIIVSDNSFDLILENFISQNHTDISQIKNIEECIDNISLYKDIQKIRDLIDILEDKDKKYFEKEFNSLTTQLDIFGF